MKSKKISEKWFYYMYDGNKLVQLVFRVRAKKKPNKQTKDYYGEWHTELHFKKQNTKIPNFNIEYIKECKFIGSTPI